MSRERVIRIAVMAAALAVPAAALAAVVAADGGGDAGCFMSWCANMLAPCGK
ncbi:MAG: hypothetical protein KTR31_28960 [Myxococcales bacterium]|nr:hypothetical protein [Myxococcales bacterium]